MPNLHSRAKALLYLLHKASDSWHVIKIRQNVAQCVTLNSLKKQLLLQDLLIIKKKMQDICTMSKLKTACVIDI